MKKYRVLAFAAIAALAVLFVAPVAVHAGNNFRAGMTSDIAKDEVIDASAYVAGSTVRVAGDVRGDLYCAGQNVDISGTVEGDVLCAGQSVSISGTVMGNIRVAGQTVTLSGQIGRNATVFGQTVVMAGGSAVGSDATVYGSSLQLDGKIGRDAVIGGQTLTLGGTVGRNVTAVDRDLSLGAAAHIGGSLDYTSNNELQVTGGAVVAGQTQRHEPPARTTRADNFATHLWGSVYWFGAFLVLGLIVLGLARRTYGNAASLMTGRVGWALVAGIVTLVMAPIAAVFLMVTVIGIPAGIALLLLWLISLAVSFVYSGYTLGAWIAGRAAWKLKWPLFSALALGLAVLCVLMLIPVVSSLVGFLALVWGLGGIVLLVGQHLKGDTDKPHHTARKAEA